MSEPSRKKVYFFTNFSLIILPLTSYPLSLSTLILSSEGEVATLSLNGSFRESSNPRSPTFKERPRCLVSASLKTTTVVPRPSPRVKLSLGNSIGFSFYNQARMGFLSIIVEHSQ